MARKLVRPEDVEIEIEEPIDSNQVPNWARREPKWKNLIDRILALPPRQSLPVRFPDKKLALTVRNTIRDTVNLRLGVAAIRTRTVANQDGSATVYFTKLAPEEVVEETRKEPGEASSE